MLVPLVQGWGGSSSAAQRAEEMRLCLLLQGVSWPWLLVDERCRVSWSRTDGDNVPLNGCVLVTRTGEEWRGWIIRETQTIRASVLSSYRGTGHECSEETTCRSLYPVSPTGHLSFEAFFALPDPLLVLSGSRGWAIVCTRTWNPGRWLSDTHGM